MHGRRRQHRHAAIPTHAGVNPTHDMTAPSATGLDATRCTAQHGTRRIRQVKSDMSKFEEALEDCKIYRKFLEDLTPVEWRREHLEKIAQAPPKARRFHESPMCCADVGVFSVGL